MCVTNFFDKIFGGKIGFLKKTENTYICYLKITIVEFINKCRDK